MAGRQAKIIDDAELRRLLRLVRGHRHAARDRVMLLLSVKAGLRACEIAGLRWSMVLDAKGRIGEAVEARDGISKKGHGRLVPMNGELREALAALYAADPPLWPAEPVVRSERQRPMNASSVVNWFAVLYQRAGLEGCSSHSGRRTFITKAARLVHRVGGSIRDVQQLAGHASLDHTMRYVEPDTAAKRALVRLL